METLIFGIKIYIVQWPISHRNVSRHSHLIENIFFFCEQMWPLLTYITINGRDIASFISATLFELMINQ